MAGMKYYPPMSIAEYQEFVRTRYEEFDRKVAVDQMVMRLFEEATELISPVQEASRNWARASQDVVSSLADILPWLCGICTSIPIDLERAMEWKYGKGCPICGRMPCECRPPQPVVARPEPPEDLFEYPKVLKRQRTLDAWQSHLREMYKDNLQFNINVLPLKLLEDIASMGKIVRTRRSFKSDKEWKAEIAWRAASILAWTIAICNYFNDVSNTNLHLHQITFEKYSSDYLQRKTMKEAQQLGVIKCPKCGFEWASLQT